MSNLTAVNRYAQLLKEQGHYVITVEGVDWYEYSGFMMPAYLPHRFPEIGDDLAKQVVRISGKPFARWARKYGQVENTAWWWVVRRGKYSMQQCSSKTRNQIRRGYKNFHAKKIEPDEILDHGYNICQKAVQRYKKDIFLPSQQGFERKVQAARRFTDSFEFFGVYQDRQLVGFAENYIQDGGVFWESIWYEPRSLSEYCSYALIDTMLNYYLNERMVDYVMDGCRSIHHKTNIQDFLIRKFGFAKEYALLQIAYSPLMKTAVNLTYPLRSPLSFLGQRSRSSLLDKVNAMLLQEHIRKCCLAK
ncbi:MAG: hypothetical protein KAR47_07705 [Planctomycetes bacterium]|nr:hypothetical protein [Planctomycetota bacterium]